LRGYLVDRHSPCPISETLLLPSKIPTIVLATPGLFAVVIAVSSCFQFIYVCSSICQI
jgi:hypothetical protein